MSDFITVITPAYNAQHSIIAAINSVRAQTYDNWEMLVVADDGFDYEHLLKRHHIHEPRLRFFSSVRRQSGPNAARNVALAHARGDWIAPLDADDIYYPDRLKRLLELAKGINGEKGLGLALDNVNITGEGLKDRLVIEIPELEVLDFDRFKQCLVPLLFLFHKQHVKRGWDEDIARGADTLFNLRALESAGGAAFCPQALHEYRVHGASMCHAKDAERIFVEAYRHTLQRLNADGLGFAQDSFREQVIAMIQEKKNINEAFLTAVENGFKGNYQSFVEVRTS